MTHFPSRSSQGLDAWLPGSRASRIESAAVLRLLAACAESGTAAHTILAAWAEDSGARQGRRLRRLATAVRRDGFVAAAITTVPGVVRDEDLVAIRFGDRTGLLPPLAARSLATFREDASSAERGAGWGFAFAAVVLACNVVVAAFMVVKIAPQFDKILADMGMPRPPVMQLWLDVCAAIARVLWLVPVVVVAWLFVMLVPPLRRLVSAFLSRPRGITAAIETLAVSAAAGTPPRAAAEVLAGCQTDRRLATLLSHVPGDGPAGRRLAAAGLVDTADAARIDAAGSAGLAAALTDVARRRRELARRTTSAWNTSFMPIIALVFGSFVLLQALAVFMPMIDMIQGLAEGRP